MMGDECYCCTPGTPGDRLCRQCFQVWYDSGITVAAVLAREVRWRKAEGIWPWSSRYETVQELDALQSLPLPGLNAERGHE
jgi:hypothetical protein